jgi:tetratricopeptide (TPR) repeat protein
VGVAVTRSIPRARITLVRQPAAGAPGAARTLARFTRDLVPGQPFLRRVRLPRGLEETALELRVTDADGQPVIAYQPKPRAGGEVPPPATEPPAPADLASADELYVTGLHLEQYRHATRCPTRYWREALRRDPLDARCNNALGLWHLRRGEFPQAETHFRNAIERLTRRNANPADGEPFYHLGLCLCYQADALPPGREPGPGARARLLEDAYAAFYKATWNQAWAGPAYHALAELDCRRQDWERAADHVERSCRNLAANSRAMNLWALIVAREGNFIAAEAFPKLNRAANPLDWWARHLLGEPMTCDTQTLLDLALDYARAGFYAEAIALLEDRVATRQTPDATTTPATATGSGKPNQTGPANAPAVADPRELGTGPLLHYHLGWLHAQAGHSRAAQAAFRRAAATAPDYCFPARLEEIAILETAIAANPGDARALACLGHLLYDRRRHEEALCLWERSVKLAPGSSVVWRNLGIGYFNIRRQPARARAAYERARRANPADARLLYERDQLGKRLGEAPQQRLRVLEKHLDLVRQRDDLSVELCALYNQTGRPADALALVSSRRFQPWEGGEGGPLGQWVRSHLALGRRALRQASATPPRTRKSGRAASPRVDPEATRTALLESAAAHFEAALTAPRNLGEAKHLLANQSDIHYWLGRSHAELGHAATARQHWLAAATFQGDFQEMRVRAFSELTCYSALAWARLGEAAKARQLLLELLTWGRELQRAPADVDYFATSLPTMLLFDDDLQFRQETTALLLQAQAHLGLGHRARGAALVRTVLQRDPNHALAADLAAGLD